ncbi:hypothetical protein HKCCE2091_06915 [Rhodobacterales bacterium HKCCE2091]|nr:hypothetical protein [Rhodobacterales bacterium HKCCE2091]
MAVNDNLDPTNTDNLHDAGGVTMTGNTRAVTLVELANGRLFMVTSERDTLNDGLSTFEIDNDPASPTYGQVLNPGAADEDAVVDSLTAATDGAGYDQIEALASVTLSNGNTFVFSADPLNDTIGVSRIGPDGTLTALPGITDSTNLDEIANLAVAEVDGSVVLIGLAGGTSDNLVSYSVDPSTGALTLVSDIADGSGTGENYLATEDALGASLVETGTGPDGTTFVIAGGTSGGISLYSVNATGALTFENARGDDRAGAADTDPEGNTLDRDVISPASTLLGNATAATFGKMGDATYVFVGGAENGVSVFRIDPDAAADGTWDLTLVGQIENVGTDLRALQFITGENGEYFLAGGGGSPDLKFAQVTVDPVTGVVTIGASWGVIADAGEPGAETWTVEDLAYHDGVLVSASEADDGVAVVTTLTCFLPDTMILAESGEVPVAELRPGDRVVTLDRGLQPVLWIGETRVTGDEMRGDPVRRPIGIAPGAFGPGVPSRALSLSRQHRVLVCAVAPDGSRREVLVHAKDCRPLAGVTPLLPAGGVRYLHLLLGQHDLLFANGLPCETLWPGDAVLPQLRADRSFPLLDVSRYHPARPFVQGKKARHLVRRILRTGNVPIPKGRAEPKVPGATGPTVRASAAGSRG